ncbi:hypothetical protein TSMEX_001289 [Taenia solium]|eukprot:TsM_000865700 transcript=TsM_000865700 gene=TsM_000865700
MEIDRTLYISNVPPKATETLVYELFLQAGPVENVSLKDGYGFVTYEDEESVLYACSLFEGIRLYNYELRIKPRQGSKYENHPIKSYPPYTNSQSCSPCSPCELREYNHLSEHRYQNYDSGVASIMAMTYTPTYVAHRSYTGRNYPYQNGYVSGPYCSLRDRSPLHRNHYESNMNCGIGTIKNIFVVTSGKGGVGKSTIACRLAIGLAKQNLKVGLLDLDLCGPSIPRIMGLYDANVQQCSEGWLPVVADTAAKNIFVMSIAFLVSDKDSAVAWRGPRKNAMIDQFLSKVCWGQLDVLVIDTPPGTSDEHISVVEKIRGYASDCLRGAIVVSTPQRVALCDIRRQLTFCSKVGLPVVGLIENMSGFECPNCKESFNLFASGGVEDLAKEKGIDFLGRLPLDCQITKISDQSATFTGKSQLALPADSPIMAFILSRYFEAERLKS